MLPLLNSQTLSLAHPEALLLVLAVVPLLMIRPGGSVPALPFSSLRSFSKCPESLRLRLRRPIFRVLIAGFILCGAIAVSAPQLLPSGIRQNSAANIMLALDVSKSMLTPDIATPQGNVERLRGVKDVVRDFVKSRPDDRIGLVVFGTDAFLQTPLTLDHESLIEGVNKLQVGMAGDKTAIGEALAHSIKRIRDLPSRSRSIILVTDGLNTSGGISPLKAALAAAENGITIHTIGIGAPSLHAADGASDEDRTGEFDEITLKKIAALTSGIYAGGDSMEALSNIYGRIDQLEKTEAESWQPPVLRALFLPFAVISLFCLVSVFLLSSSFLRRLP